MGLEDIDDDVPLPPSTHGNKQTKAGSGKSDLSDIFGDLGVPQAVRQPPQLVAQPASAPPDALAGFFTSDKPVTPPPQQQPAANALDSLFEFGATSDRKRHVDIKNESEKYLEAFGAKGGVSRRSEPTLGQMKAPSTSAVTAHLLSLMNYYDVLGVEPNASVEDIRRHYKKKALELHPDKVGRQQTPEEAQLFKTITKAHDVLTDSAQRAEYDASLAAPVQTSWFAHLPTEQ